MATWEETTANHHRRVDGLTVSITLPATSADDLTWSVTVPALVEEPTIEPIADARSAVEAMAAVDTGRPLPEWW